MFVGHAPFFKSLTHLTHKHQKSLSQKAAQLLVCNCEEATMGNSNLWAHNLLKSGAYLLDAASSTQQSSTHTCSTPLSLSLSTILLLLYPPWYTHHNQQLQYIITAPVDSTIRTASVLLASTLHSLLAPTPPTLLLSTTTTSPHSTLHSQLVTSLG